ncbi:MAG: hypothetical protein ACXVAM_09895 [Vulcanimicrobiaceae bacterium]
MLFLAIAAAAYVNRDLIRIKIASVYAPVTPKPVSETPSARAHGGRFEGDAPWALSALPECLLQTSVTRGHLAYVRAHVPRSVQPLAVPASLHYGDCTIRVSEQSAEVLRGNDRFHIPGRVQFFTAPGVLAVLRAHDDVAELRTYSPSKF